MQAAVQLSEQQEDAILEKYDRVRADLSALWTQQQALITQTSPAQANNQVHTWMVDHVSAFRPPLNPSHNPCPDPYPRSRMAAQCALQHFQSSGSRPPEPRSSVTSPALGCDVAFGPPDTPFCYSDAVLQCCSLVGDDTRYQRRLFMCSAPLMWAPIGPSDRAGRARCNDARLMRVQTKMLLKRLV